MSRRYAHIRCELDNALCLCSSAHRYITSDPGAHHDLVTEIYGPDHWHDLRGRAYGTLTKMDWHTRAAELTALADRMGLL